MEFLIPVESIKGNLGGVILYDPHKNEVLKQYTHKKRTDLPRSGWRGGVLFNDTLIATDWTDLHYFDVNKWEYIKSFEYSTFNDLHYLVIKNDKLIVVNTGIDAIETFRDPLEPMLESRIFIFNKHDKFKPRIIDMNIEYNKKYKVQPHSCHPNCLEMIDDRMFVTCFENHKAHNRSGNLIELNTGKIVMEKRNCHDGDFYKNDFYLSGTRENKVWILRDFLNREWPMVPDEKIDLLPNKGWWRGSIIKDDIMYLCASFAYGIDRPFKMVIINLKTKKIEQVNKMPILDGVVWDTVYQPMLWEEE
jgi:hypothetical protein